MKKSTLVTSMIVLITLCWASLLLMACRKEGIVAGSGTDTQTTTVKEMQAVPFDDTALQQEIASLKAQNAALANEKSARDFDYAALQSEYDKLKQQNANLEEQNRALSQRSSSLADENNRLKNEVAQLNQSLAESEAANQAAQEEIASLKAAPVPVPVVTEGGSAGSAASELADASGASKAQGLDDAAAGQATDGTSSEPAASQAAETAEEGAQVADASNVAAEGGEEAASAEGNAKKAKKDKGQPGQVRNVLGFKVGPDMVDIEATMAIMPHWFLIANMGLVETPEDFVEDKFPGHSSNHNLFSGKYNFFYDVMGGMGFNWQFNSLPAQPNVYLSTMLGPAWFLYKEDGDLTTKAYLLWRTSVGFDLTVYKDLLFTTDIGFDWMKDYDFTPRLAVGLLWRYNRDWALIGRKK